MQSIAPGLFRWTAPHPDWRGDRVEPDHPLDWPRDVGCVAAEVGERVVLIDPLVEDWDALDEVVAGRPVTVLISLPFHKRSSAQAVVRYGASTDVPHEVSAIDVVHAGEQVFWLPGHSALVPGDCLVNRPRDGAMRIMPQGWLQFFPGNPTREQVAAELHPLLDLPIERILVSHGEPVLEDARAALAAALDEAG